MSVSCRNTVCKTMAATILALLLVWTAPLQAGKKKKEDSAKANAVPAVPKHLAWAENIVWPKAPAVPRVRYIDFFSADKNASFGNAGKPKEKKSWMDRMAGSTPDVDRKADPSKSHFQLMNPYGLAVDSKNRLYVADTKVGAIFIFDTETRDTEMIKHGVNAKFGSVYGLAIDDTDRLFVVDGYYRHVMMFDANHKLQAVIGEGLLNDPAGVAVDNENRFLYVVDTGLDQVCKFDLDTFKPLYAIGTTGKNHTLTTPGDFSKPTNIAIDDEGSIYVTDTLNNRVEVFDADGKFVREFGKAGDAPGDFARPKGIAIDSDGHVWVADAMLSRIQIFTKQGKFLLAFGSFGPLPGEFQALTGLAIDKNNRVFTSEQYLARVQLFRYVPDEEARAEYNHRAELEQKAASAEKKDGAAPAQAPAAAEAKNAAEPPARSGMKLVAPEAAQRQAGAAKVPQ